MSGGKQTLIFDLDGTIYDSTGSYSSALKACGIDPQGEEFQRARTEVKSRFPGGGVAAHHRALYFKRLLENRRKHSPEALLNLICEYEKALVALIERQWKALGRVSLFKELSKHFRIALLTNETLRTQITKLAVIDPTGEIFGAILTSEEAGTEKPDLAIFRMLLQSLGTQAAECVMIGDSLIADIEPAIRLGMKAVWTTEFLSKREAAVEAPKGSLRIERLDELIRVLGY